MDPSTPSPALIVFAKAPTPGQVKTRLTGVLTEEEAARLYEAFLKDALAQYAALATERGAALRLYHAGPCWPARLTPDGASLYQQRGDGLGARMATAFRETFAAGARAALIAGTDYPTLPPAFIEEGIEALRSDPQTVCIGPSADGGYYLLGMNSFRPSLFDGMTYSHDGVFASTLARAGLAGARPVILPEWYDVDTPADLRRLAADLSGEGAGEDAARRAPHTRRRIQALAASYPSLRAAPTLS